jgi:hypothetical protein
MKYFYALKVPSSHSGAALFLKNDSRKLRKYIFRFEFRNTAVYQPPARFLQFVRSGNAAKKSMRSIDKVKKAFQKLGKEERSEVSRENKKRSQDAFAAHLGTLDELLQESDQLAEQFVKVFNDMNEEVEDEEYRIAQLRHGGMMNAPSRRKTRPLPPYWGSGFNRQILEEDVSFRFSQADHESARHFSCDFKQLRVDVVVSCNFNQMTLNVVFLADSSK